MFVKFETNSNVAGKGFNFSAVIHKKGKLISFKNNSGNGRLKPEGFY